MEAAQFGVDVARLESFFAAAGVANPLVMAKRVLAQFSSDELLGAERAGLVRCFGAEVAGLLLAARELFIHALEAQSFGRRKLYRKANLNDWLCALIGSSPVEHLIVLHLDASDSLICYDEIAIGSPTEVDFNIRRILLAAAERGASGIIIAHNHPSGDARPSQSDILVTRRVCDGARVLGIGVRDHLVVAGGHIQSIL